MVGSKVLGRSERIAVRRRIATVIAWARLLIDALVYFPAAAAFTGGILISLTTLPILAAAAVFGAGRIAIAASAIVVVTIISSPITPLGKILDRIFGFPFFYLGAGLILLTIASIFVTGHSHYRHRRGNSSSPPWART